MVRTEGSKNKPKSLKQLLDLLKTAAEKEGKTFDYSIKDLAGEIAADPKPTVEEQIAAAACKSGLSKETFSELELELEAEETNTYKCGNCDGDLSGEVAVCPHCNVPLSWG